MICGSGSTWISRFSPNGSVQRWVASPPSRVPMARIMSASRTASLPTFDELRPITPTARSWRGIDRALAAERGRDRNAERVGERRQRVPRLRDDHAAAGDDQRLLALQQQLHHARDLRAVGHDAAVVDVADAGFAIGSRSSALRAEHVGGNFEMHRPRRRAGRDADRGAQHRAGAVGRRHRLVPARDARCSGRPSTSWYSKRSREVIASAEVSEITGLDAHSGRRARRRRSTRPARAGRRRSRACR